MPKKLKSYTERIAKLRKEDPAGQPRAERPDNRPSASARGYDRKWRKIRLATLRRNPVCKCGHPATEVHHIIPLPEGTNNRENLLPLCGTCHKKITAAARRKRA